MPLFSQQQEKYALPDCSINTFNWNIVFLFSCTLRENRWNLTFSFLKSSHITPQINEYLKSKTFTWRLITAPEKERLNMKEWYKAWKCAFKSSSSISDRQTSFLFLIFCLINFQLEANEIGNVLALLHFWCN